MVALPPPPLSDTLREFAKHQAGYIQGAFRKPFPSVEQVEKAIQWMLVAQGKVEKDIVRATSREVLVAWQAATEQELKERYG